MNTKVYNVFLYCYLPEKKVMTMTNVSGMSVLENAE